MFDTMRGWTVNYSRLNYLIANSSGAETPNGTTSTVTSTGFTFDYGVGQTFIYIAIRRGPMKTPTSGTSVFTPFYANYSEGALLNTGFPLDLSVWKANTTSQWSWQDRLRGWPTSTDGGGPALSSNNTAAETSSYTNVGATKFDRNNGALVSYYADSGLNSEAAYFMFRRAPGFFDEVCYTGTGSATTVTHNLGVAPELLIVKSRSDTYGWAVYNSQSGNTVFLRLDGTGQAVTSSAYWNNTTPTSTQFTIGDDPRVNASGATYIALLFATVAGVSKVGSYTGNGSTQTINCGFTSGARFVVIKQTSGSGGDWAVYSTAMGIVAGTDRTLYFNRSNSTSTFGDTLDADNAGFELGPNSASFGTNINGETYIFLAIA
jgi:hypothetical protein